MKHSRKIAVGVLSTAVLLQNLGTVPLLVPVPAVTASAAAVQTIQTRIYEYDFHTFKALYDIRTKRWFTEDGAQIVSGTQSEQQMTAADDSRLKLSLNFEKQTAAVCSGSTEQDCTDQFRKLFFDPLSEITPAYEQQSFYDRAQQKTVPLPEPESFPLTYVCGEEFRNSAPAKLDCQIKFGEQDYGTVGFSMSGSLFSTDPDTGLLLETAGELKNKATVTPYTSAGDVNFNRVTDISDAVIASRVVAEDYKAKITDIGKALADQNCDDRLDSGDITDIICDVAGIPYEQRVPAGTVPIISLKDLTLADAKQIFGEEPFDDDICRMTRLVPGEPYDTWYAVWYNNNDDIVNTGSMIRSITLNCEGVVEFRADVLDPYHHSFFWGIAMQVPHNALPDDTVISFDWEAVEQLSKYAPDIRYITNLPVPESSIPVLQTEQPAEDLETLAQTFGYENTDALLAAAKAEPDSELYLQKCTPGTETDVWDFAVLNPNGLGICGWDEAMPYDIGFSWYDEIIINANLFTLSGQTAEKKDFIRYRITVPHGALPENLKTKWIVWNADRENDRMPSVRYISKWETISVYEEPASGEAPKRTIIPGYSEFLSGLQYDNLYMPEDILTAADASENPFVCRVYTDPDTTPDPEAKDFLNSNYDVIAVYFKIPADAEGGYYSRAGVESAVIAGNTLQLRIAEYRPTAQPDIPVHSDKLLLAVTKNVLSLAGIDNISVKKDAFYDSVRCYTAGEKPDGNAEQNEDGTWNVYEYDDQLDDYYAATDQYGGFVITGDLPDEYTKITQTVNVSVINFMTGEPVPGFEMEILPDSFSMLKNKLNDTRIEWTTDAETPVRSFELSGYKMNYDPGAYDTTAFRVKVRSTLKGFESPDAKEFRITGDSEPLNIVLYTYPDHAEENVHFSLIDRTTMKELLQKPADCLHTGIMITDQNGTQMYSINLGNQSDFLLPDGTYTVRLVTSGSSKYVLAEPDQTVQTGYDYSATVPRTEKTFTITVQDGVPDQPVYTIGMLPVSE